MKSRRLVQMPMLVLLAALVLSALGATPAHAATGSQSSACPDVIGNPCVQLWTTYGGATCTANSCRVNTVFQIIGHGAIRNTDVLGSPGFGPPGHAQSATRWECFGPSCLGPRGFIENAYCEWHGFSFTQTRCFDDQFDIMEWKPQFSCALFVVRTTIRAAYAVNPLVVNTGQVPLVTVYKNIEEQVAACANQPVSVTKISESGLLIDPTPL